MNANQSIGGAAGRSWGWMLVYGILLIVVGFFAMFHPLVTGLAMGTILGVSFLFGGIGSLIAAFKDGAWQNKLVDVLFGLLALLAAFICIANPFSGAVSIVWAIGVMFLISGGYELVAGFRTDNEKVWLILLGIVDLLLGFWATFIMPGDAALVALAALVGMVFVFRGGLLVALSTRLRGLSKA
ncbi:MAG: DUF308 domain-containing protein [Sphingomonadales bacterium]|nr:DUF308 domain-containing protein [Sphingomonadales bacterium]